MRLIEHKTALYGIQIFLRTNIDTDHKNVMQNIRNLECSVVFAGLNFQPGSYKDAQNQERPEYLITRDGFTLLVMGFTGDKAMQWKNFFAFCNIVVSKTAS